jgi:hypothetical protein
VGDELPYSQAEFDGKLGEKDKFLMALGKVDIQMKKCLQQFLESNHVVGWILAASRKSDGLIEGGDVRKGKCF